MRSLAVLFIVFLFSAASRAALETRACSTILQQVTEADIASAHAVELIRQLKSEPSNLDVISRANQKEIANRALVIHQLQEGNDRTFFRGEVRPLNVFSVRISRISELNNDYLTISYTEQVLEDIFVNLQKKLDEFPISKILLHRWSGIYAVSPLKPAEFEREVLEPLRAYVKTYLEARKSSDDVRRYDRNFRSWDDFLKEAIAFDSVEFNANLIPGYQKLSRAKLFRQLMVEAHLASAFRLVRYAKFTPGDYEAWRGGAAQRALRIDSFLTRNRISLGEAMYYLHNFAFKQGLHSIFVNWLKQKVGGARTFPVLISDFEKLLQDFKVSSFLQYGDDKTLKPADGAASPVAFLQGMNPFDDLPESSIERRRILLDRAMKSGGYVIAGDLQSLGVLAKMEMFQWFLGGADKALIPEIFTRMNSLLATHFRAVRAGLETVTGAPVQSYVTGDDTFDVLGRVSAERAARASAYLLAHPLDISSLYPGDRLRLLKVYSSGAVEIPRGLAPNVAVGASLAKARDLLNEQKLTSKSEIMGHIWLLY
jgi:hypothetical protein